MAREYLRKVERIRSSAEFEEVFQKGKSCGGKHLVLFYLERQGRGTAVGFTTTRRVKSAVTRNRAKRLMREAYRRLKQGIRSEGQALVFLARGDARGMSLDDVQAEMAELLGHACLWSG